MLHGDPDVVCLSETHLKQDERINLPGYKYYGNARSAQSARKSGGVAVLVREGLFSDYMLGVICCDTDGILGICLEHKLTAYCTGIVCNYLPPASSIYGMDPENFYGRLLQLSYECHDYDLLLYVGDFNSRIGQSPDTTSDVVPARLAVDRTINSHGKCLLDFLNDADACVLNGRFGDHLFTCNTANGSSVVDYAITHTDMFDKIRSFRIVEMDSIINEHAIEYMVHDGSTVPDHELITLDMVGTGYHLDEFVRGLGANNEQKRNKRRIPRKFKVDFMCNERIKAVLGKCIDDLEQSERTQTAIDQRYRELSREILWEMDKFKKLSKRTHTPYRPYWNEGLSALWKDLNDKYKLAKSALHNVNKKKLKRHKSSDPLIRSYQESQHRFDHELRGAKKKYSEICVMNIEKLSATGNPRDFWNEVNKLGPRSKKTVTCEALDEGGNATRDAKLVMDHWKKSFAELYGTAPTGDFDEDFLREKKSLLSQHCNVNLDADHELNQDITLMEVKKAVDGAKKGKAVGFDGIPTEALQNGMCIATLHRLYNLCFASGVLPSDWSKCNIVPIGKGKSSVPTEPLSHRGLALQCCIYKLYCVILNNRLYSHAETRELLSETQNGFRKNRSCTEHVFTLTETIKLNLPLASSRVYSCFVDIKKAFPSVNRDLLMWRINDLGISGRMYAALRASFKSPQCRLVLPVGETEFFDNLYGTLEGSPNSPLNFSLFLDGLLKELSESGLGIYYGSGVNDRFAVLAYADDLVLLASSESDLQRELHVLYKFCCKWRLNVNTDKTKAMVF